MISPMLLQRIEQHFIDSADLKYQLAPVLSPVIQTAVEALLACVTSGGKVVTCGDRSSVAGANYFAEKFVGQFERERPELAAMALRANAHDLGLSFARQIRALGQPSDMLLAISLQGEDPMTSAAIEAAHERDMVVIALIGGSAEVMPAQLRDTDILIQVAHERPARIQEAQLLILNCLCDGVDLLLLGDNEVQT